jgi:RHS repeat-associated protein
LVEVRDASNNLIATYTYDGQSRRVKKVTSSLASQGVTEEVYVYDGWNRIATYSTQNSTFSIQNCTTFGRDLSGTLEGAGGVGGLLGIKEGANSYRVSYDANGNVSELIAATGNMAAHYEYDPFGNVVVSSGNYAVANPWRFSTKPVDLETGYSYYGYRFYNPVDGRWVSKDLINELGFKTLHGVKINRMRLREETNLHAFVANNPVGFVDPFGLAYFAYRPLGGPLDILGVTGNDLDNSLNTVIGHEQIFFEDGKSPSNIGFFDNSALNSESDTSKYRSSHDKGWSDCVMRKAVAATPAGSYCLLGEPGATEKFNCQDWAEAVRKTYRRLIKRQEVVADCCPTDAEKKK